MPEDTARPAEDHGDDAWRVTLRSEAGDLRGVIRSTAALQALAAHIEPLPWVVIASPVDSSGRPLVVEGDDDA